MVTNNAANQPTGASGTVLQGQGVGTASAFSTATFPSTATSTGTILRANGTNWVATTATYPTTTTSNQILYSSATSVVGEITTANNSILSTNGSGVPSLGTSLTNDYTFTSSTAAATRTLTVSNTDNTSSSSTSVILSKTGGASSGDAVHQSSTTTTNWTWGIDNSVTSPTADPWVLAQGTALGTNNVMSVATSGEINYPLQPSFFATAGAVSDVTGDGTAYTVIFGTEIFDQNADFDGTSTFTAPVTGRYRFDVKVAINGLGVANTSGDASIVTSNRTLIGVSCNWGVYMNSSNLARCQHTALTDMDAADTATVTITISGGTKVVDIVAGYSFSGDLNE